MIEDFALHDATLLAVSLVWADGRCTMTVRHSQLSYCSLTFKGITNLTIVSREVVYEDGAEFGAKA